MRFLVTSQLLFLLICGCAGTPTRESAPDSIQKESAINASRVEPKAQKLFLEAEREYSRGNYNVAAMKYRIVVTNFPEGKASQYSTYRLGTIYYTQGQYKAASEQFERYLSAYPKSDLNFDVIYNLAASEFQLGKYESASGVLSQVSETEIRREGAERSYLVYQLMAKVASATGNSAASVKYFSRQLELNPKGQRFTETTESAKAELRKLSVVSELEMLKRDAKSPVLQTLIAARIEELEGSPSIRVSENKEADEPPSASLGSGSGAEKLHIGVVLPLTGKWSSQGKQALDGILLAGKVFAGEGGSKSQFEFFIKDTASSEINARNVVEELYSENDVVAIIGPISWSESLAVAKRSQELGVVNLSLAFKDGIAAMGPYLFQNAITPKTQIESLLRYCVTEKNMTRFAMLYPDDSFGNEMATQFWQTAERYGAHIVGDEPYSPKETDFQKPIKRMVGLADPRLREAEVKAIESFIEEQKKAGVRNPKATLPPVLDFDAIFIPDNPKTVGQIAPSLAFLDVTGKPLLGTTEWNSDQLYKRGGKYVEGALFPAGINPATKNAAQKSFIQEFSQAYGTAPKMLSAQAFEATEILMAAVQRMDSSNRNELVYKLFELKNFETPFGNISFDSNRVAQRNLPIYTLGYGGRISEIPLNSR